MYLFPNLFLQTNAKDIHMHIFIHENWIMLYTLFGNWPFTNSNKFYTSF